MADETTGATPGQVPDVAQPQAGTGSSSQAEGASKGAAVGSGTGDSDVAAIIRERDEARREAAKNRTELRKFQEAQQAAADAELTEVARRDKRIAELERQIAESQVRERERNVRIATIEAASRLGFRNPELAYNALDRSRLEYAEDGAPKNVEKLLKALLESDPYLARPAADFGGGQRGATPSGQPSMNDLLRAAAGNR